MVMLSRLVSRLCAASWRPRRLGRESGQAVTENMLIISVIVISIVGGAQSFIGTFRSGVQELGNDVSDILTSGSIGGVGFSGSGGGSNGNGGGGGRGRGNGASSGNSPRVNGGPSFNRAQDGGATESDGGGFNTNSAPGGRFGNGSFDTAGNNNRFDLPPGLGFPMPPQGDTA